MLWNGQDAARTCCTSNGVGAAITILRPGEGLSRLQSLEVRDRVRACLFDTAVKGKMKKGLCVSFHC
jgi:hypothetical protein